VVYRGPDRQQQRDTFRTRSEAIEGKRIAARRVALTKAHSADLHRVKPHDECPECDRERQEREESQPTLHEYAREWIESYQGTGRRGFRPETRDEARRLLERYALRYFPDPTRLTDIGPKTSTASSAGSSSSPAGARERSLTARCATRLGRFRRA
jgi:hypothetical protein